MEIKSNNITARPRPLRADEHAAARNDGKEKKKSPSEGVTCGRKRGTTRRNGGETTGETGALGERQVNGRKTCGETGRWGDKGRWGDRETGVWGRQGQVGG